MMVPYETEKEYIAHDWETDKTVDFTSIFKTMPRDNSNKNEHKVLRSSFLAGGGGLDDCLCSNGSSEGGLSPSIFEIGDEEEEEPEPSPIDPMGSHQVCSTINSLPDTIKKYSADYISLLSNLCKEDNTIGPVQMTHSSHRSRSLKKVPSSESLSQGHQEERWLVRFQELIEYHKVHGHFNVGCKENPPLFQWVKRQRYQHKLGRLGRHSNLTKERIQKLDGIGFVWDSHRLAWDEKFAELKEFHRVYGHCFVPCTYNGNSKLSTWIKRQRHQYRLHKAGKPSTLCKERINKMEAIGFLWDYYGSKFSR